MKEAVKGAEVRVTFADEIQSDVLQNAKRMEEKFKEALGDLIDKNKIFRDQEMAREANTIGQKVSDTELGRTVIELKTEIDRLRRWFDTVDAELLACDLDGQPRRIAHHDCKVNNVLFDRESRDAVCVVDLDTVMEGTLLSDFGELVRTAACPSPEDEIYRAGMHLDVEVLRALSHGYLMGAAPLVTDAELQVLPLAGLTLALMNAIRFLTDDLEGDRYFHVDREGHNLDRCRAQLRLVELLHEHREATREILREAAGELGLPR